MEAGLFAALLSGCIFGVALGATGMASPSQIIAQMHLQSYHMVKVFLMGTATSAFVVFMLNKKGALNVQPHPASSLGWINAYDGNIIGGLIFGTGMALAGICPGTVLIQLANGLPSARFGVIGGLVGAALYHVLAQHIPSQPVTAATRTSLYTKLGYDQKKVFTGFEAMCATVVVLAMMTDPSKEYSGLPPILGGLSIGAAQYASLALTGNALSVSASFAQPILYAWQLCDKLSGYQRTYPINHGSTVFAVGMFLGPFGLQKVIPAFTIQDQPYISPVRALIGGIAVIFGARLAGGCTSGHGISGVSLLSISSIITVMSMFIGGIGTATILG